MSQEADFAVYSKLPGYIENARENAYKKESDGLFFMEQRNEVEKGTWLKKCAEIQGKYPKAQADPILEAVP